MWDCINWKKVSIFVGGALFGSAGLKILSGKDAKKVYTHTTAAALRCKECVMDTVTKVQANVDDIVAEAKEINKEREREAAEKSEAADMGHEETETSEHAEV